MRVRQASLLLVLVGLGLPAGSCIGGGDGGDDPASDPAAKHADGPVLQTLPPFAPPLDLTVATNLYDLSRFLYEGKAPVQRGVKPGTIDRSHVAVLRGFVRTRDGQPLTGVRVSAVGHPEFGETSTRDGGIFDLVVNGGGLLTVAFDKDGFLPAHRQLDPAWQRFAWADPLVLVPVDAQVTAVDLSAGQPGTFQVHRSVVVSDHRGTRQATVLFPPGTQATVPSAQGEKLLSTLHVRATEYTVGKDGLANMPASLPKNSGYTYALELSVDEAMAQNAPTVNFSKPVSFYVDNFLHFDVGALVPTGYYDRQRAAWVASDSGRVIQILSIDNGMATLDVQGKGGAATSRLSVGIDISDDERRQLAALYKPGDTLFRVQLRHFTTWDCNWSWVPPAGAISPSFGPLNSHQLDSEYCAECAQIAMQNQARNQSVPVTGAPLSLSYGSDQTAGHSADYQVTIPLTPGGALPSSMTRIDLEVLVAGQTYTQSFPPSNMATSTTYTWNGQDAFGRVLQGRQPITVRVGYIYNGVYQATPTFGQSGTQTTVSAATQETGLWQQWNDTVGTFNQSAQQNGGFELSVHHTYDAGSRTLFLGDGSRRSGQAAAPAISTFAGGGTGGDGGPAATAGLVHPTGVALAPDGSLYIVEWSAHRVRKVSPGGVISTFAGSSTGVSGYSGDGGPATSAKLYVPFGVALGADGSVYIADQGNNAVRKVTPDGIIHTLAGGGTLHGASADGGPATSAYMCQPTAVAVGGDGSVYIAEMCSSTIRRVTTDGNISTIAGYVGTGYVGAGYGGDGGPATSAYLDYPYGVAVGPDGSVYIADTGNLRVRKVTPGGTISTVAGNGVEGSNGDGGPATSARLNAPYAVSVGADGALYIADTSNLLIRRVDGGGIINTVAGIGIKGTQGDGGSALLAQFSMPVGLAVASDGSLYIADGWLEASNLVRKVAPPLPGYYAGAQVNISSEDGSEVYVFDGNGRHLKTVEPLLGAVRYQFGYDGSGRVTTVTDGDGNVTTVQRDMTGNATAIVGPFGQQTTLAMDMNGNLATVTNPAGEATTMTYGSGGLLATVADPKGNTHTLTFGAGGRLTNDADPAGGSVGLSRTDQVGGYTVSATTAMGRTSSYQVSNTAPWTQVLVNTDAAGMQTQTTINPKLGTASQLPDGTQVIVGTGPDPRFGMQAPTQAVTITTPGGLNYTSSETRAVTLSDPTNPLSLLTANES